MCRYRNRLYMKGIGWSVYQPAKKVEVRVLKEILLTRKFTP